MPFSGLYFIWNSRVYLPGDTIFMLDIGESNYFTAVEPRLSLVCITSNFNNQCCRSVDGGNVGEWLFPNGSMVPRRSTNYIGDFTRSGYTNQIRLHRQNNATVPTGIYTCMVPDESNMELIHTATILIGDLHSIMIEYEKMITVLLHI